LICPSISDVVKYEQAKTEGDSIMRRIPFNARRIILMTAAGAALAGAAVAGPIAASGASSMHVGDLDGSVSSKSSWQAKITITVHGADDRPLSGVTVGGAWTDGATGTASCKTGRRGTCTVTSPAVGKTTLAITFEMLGATAPGYLYDEDANHDPDGSSDGSAITVTR
jgi:hypothetical protein